MTKITTRQKQEKARRKQAKWGRKYKEFLKAKALLLGYKYEEGQHVIVKPSHPATRDIRFYDPDTLELIPFGGGGYWNSREKRFADGLRKFKEENR